MRQRDDKNNQTRMEIERKTVARMILQLYLLNESSSKSWKARSLKIMYIHHYDIADKLRVVFFEKNPLSPTL